MSCGVYYRCSSDPVLLWRRLAAVVSIQRQDWELPLALGAVLKKNKHTHTKKTQTNKKQNQKKPFSFFHSCHLLL